MQVSRRALSAKERGRKGGIATAQNHNDEFFEQRSAKAGTSTRDRYGIGFYSYLNSLRKTKSTKDKVNQVIRKIVPSTEPIPETSADLMIAAAKNLA